MSPAGLPALLRSHDPVALVRISRAWRSMLRMHFLHAALESGLLEALRRPRTREELIAELAVRRPEILDALLDLGLSLGELRRTGERVALRGRSSRALANDGDGTLAAMVQANATYYNTAFRRLPDSMTGGALVDRDAGFGPLVSRLSRISEPFVDAFLVRLLAGSEAMRVLDVGCGSGSTLKMILEHCPAAIGVGIEIDPDVVAQASGNLRTWGLADRAQALLGDGVSLPEEVTPPFDVVLLMSVIYYVAPEARVGLLSALRATLAPSGTLVVSTSCRGEDADPFSANLNVATSMMSGLTQLPTAKEVERDLKRSGFDRIDRHRLVRGTTYFAFTAS